MLLAIGELLRDQGRLAEALAPIVGTASEQQQIPVRAQEIAAGWSELPAGELHRIVSMLSRRITLRTERIEIEISGRGLRPTETTGGTRRRRPPDSGLSESFPGTIAAKAAQNADDFEPGPKK